MKVSMKFLYSTDLDELQKEVDEFLEGKKFDPRFPPSVQYNHVVENAINQAFTVCITYSIPKEQ